MRDILFVLCSLLTCIIWVAARAELIVSCFVSPGPQPVPRPQQPGPTQPGNAMRVTWGLGCLLCLLKTRFTQIHFTTIVTIRHEGCDVSACFLIKSNDGKIFYIRKIGQTFVNIANCPHFTRHVPTVVACPWYRVRVE